MIGFLISGLFYSCQENVLDPDASGLKNLKNGVIEGTPMSGTLPSGALYDIQIPATWELLPVENKILLVYAHGYVNADRPVELPSDSISNGYGGQIAINDFVVGNLNMGFATTSYRSNGLVAVDAVEDIVMLRSVIQSYFDPTNPQNPGYSPPTAVILVGPSEGGLVTVLTIEQYPDLFNAALATCGPIGNFYRQLQYYGNAHVLFKYFFGPSVDGINLGSPKRISKHTMDAWNDGTLQAGIIKVLQEDYMNNDGNKIMQFLRCSHIPADVTDPESVISAILSVLRFPIMATNDAIERLGGNPFNNKYPMRMYSGSDNDRKLNLTVERIYDKNWPTAAQNVADSYETTGALLTPLVTMHTEFDPVALYQHELAYFAKVNANSPYPQLLIPIKIPNRYGHCNFMPDEIIGALNQLSQLLN